jgi:phenylalanyl-tRNA synthetase alpha chain
MQELEKIVAEAEKAIAATSSVADLEQAKARFLGKAGSLTELLKGLGKLPPEEKPKAGAAINQAKVRVEGFVQARRDSILASALDSQLAAEAIDVTLPGRRQGAGGLHPIALAQEEVEKLFASMGFSVADGPEIESDWYNFTSLRMLPDHPSRSMQDTFYIAGTDRVLRTQTSPVQIRFMESHKPPIRIICPGRVYRNDHDATHSPMFHQIEALWVDEGISLADLKATITQFCRAFFERDEINLRFRPSYFPFVEPGVEIDARINGDHVPEKLRGRWIEMMGAGMVHPNVLKNAGVDASKYQGFAFGMGLDRLAMLRWGIDDVRLMHSADLRFINQF